MKINWMDILLILLGLFIAYQLLRVIFGGSWQTESIIISLLMLNLGLTWRFAIRMEGHINWHKLKDRLNG